MRGRTRFSATAWRLSAITFALGTAVACHSSAESKSSERSVAAASDGSATHIDVMCMGDRINNPPEAFHYAYKYTDAAGTLNENADITPQAMDITIRDAAGSHSYHGLRSDEASWNGAVLDLSSLTFTAMSARLNSLEGSGIKPQGTETVNGYRATRYAIDTTQASASDQQQFETLFGKGSFDKGTVWIAADECAAKLLLDEGLWQQDGSIKKTHYEISRSKK
jgi:hypothetical protein